MTPAQGYALVWCLSLLLLSGCGGSFLLEGPLSPPPRSTHMGLRAGFGRADITPPAGVGLAGNGPEGQQARGHRLRLYARALMLEDAAGHRLVLVVTDLPLGSALLHRRVAALTAVADSIGVDRLILSATHTHSGPNHYLEAAAFNEQSSTVRGYDPVLVDSLSRRIAAAVHAAKLDLREAKAAWGSLRIWGYTRIRSLPALLRNLPAPATPADAPDTLSLEQRLIDPQLSMLRIDQRDPVTGSYRPKGAFSIFAIHGTGNGALNELLDADVQGIIERRLERHIDATPGFVPKAFHLFTNGTEGDVSPEWPRESRCPVPVLAPWPALAGPFMRPLWQWRPVPPALASACLHAARQSLERIGVAVGDLTVELFESLTGKLDDKLELAHAFTTLALREDADSLGICSEPAIGMASVGGANDAPTRMNRWRLFGILSIGLAQGAANPRGHGCHGAKHKLLDVLFGGLPNRLAVARKLPSFAQVTVVRIGSRLLGTIPGEISTTAGQRIREAMVAAARQHGVPADSALLMGLSNGHLAYVTTREEYATQFYEGGSTLYGPGEAAMFARVLADLIGELSNPKPVMVTKARAIEISPGKRKAILRPTPWAGVPSSRIERVWCAGDTLYADYQLGTVQDWPVSEAQLAASARVEVLLDGEVVAWDDDPAMELHLGSLRKNPARWQLRWSNARPGGNYRIRLRGGLESVPVRCKES
jgi:neutral ceramidase